VTLLQRAAPEELVARVFGVYDQLNVGAIALGSLVAGPLADRLGAGNAIIVVGVCGLIAVTWSTSRMNGGLGRHAAARRAEVGPRVAGANPGP
jgi:uncharacterized protein YcfJ